jgi:hypothetical protein
MACKGDKGALFSRAQGMAGAAVGSSPCIEVKDAQWTQAGFTEEDGSDRVTDNGRAVFKTGTDPSIAYPTEIPTPGIIQAVPEAAGCSIA